jgi:hypothetical protein
MARGSQGLEESRVQGGFREGAIKMEPAYDGADGEFDISGEDDACGEARGCGEPGECPDGSGAGAGKADACPGGSRRGERMPPTLFRK